MSAQIYFCNNAHCCVTLGLLFGQLVTVVKLKGNGIISVFQENDLLIYNVN